ncbi:ImmA/IrrE family metallo-endopeptidase [Microcoleus sp. N9_A1]|uniref:ImmA/IrrE family metallo-endopeptidase n=1 Tax=Microcoleus sp. N9_A1 TaxID=3055380 RepID=UPI000D0518C6|nr:Zn peptidase [filamentous cyanobacterium Phorm 46]PSB53544.1 Zn peptidase [filamentous cyanobacterium Phorm 6]
MSVIKPYRYLTKNAIESEANELLLQMQGTPNSPKWPFVADQAANYLKLSVVWDSLPSHNNRPVFARIYPQTRIIEFNEDIPELQQNRGLEQSTLAHEIGHWMLHVNQNEADGFVQQLELSLSDETAEQPFLCRKVTEQHISKSSTNKQFDSIEWQAQYFASCLLMPTHILEEKRIGRDLTREFHLDAMAQDIGVTKSNLKHRLKDVGWICIPKGSKQIYLGNGVPNEQMRLF